PAFDTSAAVANQVIRSEIPEYVLHAAAPTNRVQPPYQVELQVNSAPMVSELDTGSAVTLCSEKSWQDNLGPTVKGSLQQATDRLRTYTGEEVKLLGTKNVNVSYKGVTVNETILLKEVVLAQAYEQLELTEEAEPVTTISTHRGLFMFNRLPFGIHSAPSLFQRTIENVIAGIPKTFVYLDDIMITGCTTEEHLKLLKLVLDRLKECGSRIKKEKCDFLVDHVDYLGFRISADGLAPLAEKIRSILEAPQPRNKHELRSFLGMVNHYARFIPQAATLFHPLNYLLRQGVSLIWNREQEKVFQQAKCALTNPPVLTHFDSTQPIVLACDASPYGVGAVLSQKDKSGILKPVAYASRSLSPSERKYAQINKEALAILFGVTRFQHHLFGQTSDIFTDHKPLFGILGENKPIPQMTSPRMQRSALKHACCRYHLRYAPGQGNLTADALSPLPLQDVPLHRPKPAELLPITAAEVRVEKRKDPELSRVLRFTSYGWPENVGSALSGFYQRLSELSVEEGCLLWGA
ncbi:reverse transcriptase, partial [Opisthorchis viverrini]